MKFGKRLRTQIEDMLPEWRNHFLSYKHLKKRLKTLNGSQDGGSPRMPSTSSETDISAMAQGNEAATVTRNGGSLFAQEGPLDAPVQGPFTIEEEEFVKLLNEELKKFNTFFMGKEEDFVMRYDHLRRKLEQLTAACDADDVTQCASCAESVNDVRRDIVTFHGELVLLENYSSLNYTGLAKILKKHDKRTGMLLRVPYLQTALRQPFYTTEQLTKFMRWCEEKLQFLLSSCHSHDSLDHHAGCTDDDGSTMEKGEDSPVGESTDNMREIYKSTVAALRALQELRQSSTPLAIPMPSVVVNRARSDGSSPRQPPGLVRDSRGGGGGEGSDAVKLENRSAQSCDVNYWMTDSDDGEEDDVIGEATAHGGVGCEPEAEAGRVCDTNGEGTTCRSNGVDSGKHEAHGCEVSDIPGDLEVNGAPPVQGAEKGPCPSKVDSTKDEPGNSVEAWQCRHQTPEIEHDADLEGRDPNRPCEEKAEK